MLTCDMNRVNIDAMYTCQTLARQIEGVSYLSFTLTSAGGLIKVVNLRVNLAGLST